MAVKVVGGDFEPSVLMPGLQPKVLGRPDLLPLFTIVITGFPFVLLVPRAWGSPTPRQAARPIVTVSIRIIILDVTFQDQSCGQGAHRRACFMI